MTARCGTSGKEDMRQRRSKQHLTDALLSLMEERPYGDITVVDICQRAMVHRATFYAHFEDKNDLFQYVLRNMMDRFSAGRARAEQEKGLREGIRDEFRKVLEFFHTHHRLQIVSLGGPGSPELRMMEEAIAEVLEKFILEKGDPSFWEGNSNAVHMWGHFYAGAIMSTVNWWLEKDMPLSEEEMVSLMEHVLPERW